ncbi:TonB-dependent receptor [Flavihumibacter profundi]|uniref:TonB-dependent receptor n=1 Tax=Flavihumibacter profundi TaxID=2716883 RepID=UPI001CC44A19|nr:TonB-dependent receptor [Flavihumibacter profundi]MBZ5856024.1 TonB-dependent receptor [Flavihumibacter profundi]
MAMKLREAGETPSSAVENGRQRFNFTTEMKYAFLLLLLLPFALKAQVYRGRLVDGQYKTAIDAATILTTKGYSAISDKDGYFSIKAGPSDSIFISKVGYLGKSMLATTNNTANVIYLSQAMASLDEIVVVAKLDNALLSNMHKIDLTTRPLNNSQEILRMVPGLFIGQHAGGGKAEQLFLRGFDVDHGTDVNISADGIPVNMVSHAHGQGYADLHFVIPETIEKLDFGKGPYYADKGDFTTAGYVALHTFNELPKNMVRVEGGIFNTLRTAGLFNVIQPSQKQNAYIAGELYFTDGPFEHPQNLERYNLSGKHQFHFKNATLTTQASTLYSKWNASGLIPERAVADGSIGWFGAIDPNQGGQTSRTNLSTKLTSRLKNGGTMENQVYYSNYNFELYSNYTFFKEDTIHGDQIRQKENRNLFGYNGSFTKEKYLRNGASLLFKAGANFRHDDIRNLELSRTYQRTEVTEPMSFGPARETSLSGYLSETYKKNNWTINGALRYDYFNFQYRDDLNSLPNKSVGKGILGPKLNLQYQASKQTALYLKAGRGFHSNDARVVIPENGQNVLPAAWGSDLGIITKPLKNMLVNAAAWFLYLDQEFIYVGDEAVVEPGGKTFRKGIDVSIRYEIFKHLFADIDANYTIGRAIDEPKNAQYLPLAPKFSSTGGLAYTGVKFNAGLRYRWLGNRPADQTNTVIAKGYFITDANATWHFNKTWSAGLVAENIFNLKWKETQFLTESRLYNEPIPVEEIHFTPGTPFFVKARLTIEF